MMCLGKINFTELSRLFSYLPQYCDKQEGGRKGGIKKEKKVLVESASKKKKFLSEQPFSQKSRPLWFQPEPQLTYSPKKLLFYEDGPCT